MTKEERNKILEELLKEAKRKLTSKPSSEKTLKDWFARKGAGGSTGGWVDCNTCRNGKCKPCGRQEGEKRKKYPACRPTPAACKKYKATKGKSWGKGGKKKKRADDIRDILIKNANISEELRYHIENDISVIDNVFRPSSEKYFELIREAKYANQGLLKTSSIEREILDTDIGEFGFYNGERVPLDFPLPNIEIEKEAAEYKGKKVKLNRPMRSSGPKKYKVYVKDPKSGNVRKINFGDKKGGLKLNIHDAAARRSFVARHKCKEKNNKMTPGYWACRIGRFKHLIGGKKGYTWW
jgi:hypothetical protein